jgi:ankyrin repeat protein
MDELIIACNTNNTEVIDKIINEIDIETIDSITGKSVLVQLIDAEYEEYSIKFLNRIIEQNKLFLLGKADNNFSTPLILACEYEFILLAEKLLKFKECNSGYIDNVGYSALTICCSNDNLEEIGIEIVNQNKNGECIGCVTKDLDRTPLIHACFNSLEKLSIRLLEESNSNFIHIDTYTSKNALIYSLEMGLEDTASILIDKMNNFTLVDEDQYTPLMTACSNSLSTIALKIIQKGNCFEETLIKNVDTALIIAATNELEDVAIEIIKIKNDIEYLMHRGEDGFTVFEIACKNNLQELIDLLLEKLNIDTTIPILVKHRVYNKIKKLLNDTILKDKIKKILFDELCVNDILDIVKEITSSKSLDELEDYIKKLETSPIECLICCKPTITHYLLKPCNHVLKLDPICLNKINDCPLCRKNIETKEIVFLV